MFLCGRSAISVDGDVWPVVVVAWLVSCVLGAVVVACLGVSCFVLIKYGVVSCLSVDVLMVMWLVVDAFFTSSLCLLCLVPHSSTQVIPPLPTSTTVLGVGSNVGWNFDVLLLFLVYTTSPT